MNAPRNSLPLHTNLNFPRSPPFLIFLFFHLFIFRLIKQSDTRLYQPEPSFPNSVVTFEHLRNSPATKTTVALSTVSVLYNGGGEGFNFNFICFLPEVEISSLLVSVRLFFGNKKKNNCFTSDCRKNIKRYK